MKSCGKTKVLSAILALALIFVLNLSEVAALDSRCGSSTSFNSVSVKLSELDKSVCFNVIDAKGFAAQVGIERISSNDEAWMPRSFSASETIKVWYSGVTIQAYFYMTVSNNVCTNVSDYSVSVIGGSYSNVSLTRTSTTGKLSFTVSGIAGWFSSSCWLKGTVTGSNNQVTVSWQM